MNETNGRPQTVKHGLRNVAFDEQERLVLRRKAEMEAHQAAEKKRAEFESKVIVTAALTGKLPREGMAEVFFAAARRVAMEVLLGNVPIRNGSDAGAAIKALTDAGRIEMGQGEAAPDITTPPRTREEAEQRLRLLGSKVAEERARLAQTDQAASGE